MIMVKTSLGWVGPSSSLVRVDSETDSPGWNDNKKFELDEQDEPCELDKMKMNWMKYMN